MTDVQTILLTEIKGWSLVARGKVRDLYDAGGGRLLFVATDRISAFDCVLPNGIPRKGEVLTQLSLFWFDYLRDILPNHVITADASKYPAPFHNAADLLQGRSMLVRRAKIMPVECVVRGYLSGSAWKDYQRTGAICGIPLPSGLKESARLPEPIFTPATKAESGHDENIPFAEMERIVEANGGGPEVARRMRDLSMALYGQASERAETRGIILADTKFEMGLIDGQVVLADELLTPDSSRFWPRDQYRPGGAQPSFDKQFVRDYLETLDWDKQPPAPSLPTEVVERTSEKYLEAFRLLTGRAL